MYADKQVVPRAELDEQLSKRKKAVKMILETIPNEDAEREGLLETPKRVALMYEELFGGYEMDPHDILNKTFDAGKLHDEDEDPGSIYANGLVIVKDITFYSQCEHHMAPFFGKAHIAYVAKERVVGLSKMARLVECYARRLQVQERLTNEIADAIKEELEPLGVMVVIQAKHTCMCMRGIKKPGSSTVTSSVSGCFADNVAARNEALTLMGFKI